MSSRSNTPINMTSAALAVLNLNAPQTRALILRDELRWIDRSHLDTLLAGIHAIEPPNYKRINGTVQPPLLMVTLKDKALRFPLGNVYFDKNGSFGKGVFVAYLTFENGAFELRTQAASRLVDGAYDPVPIHWFVAGNMVPLFEAKFKAIRARMNQVNQMRQVAFNMASQQTVEEEFRQGETLASLDVERITQNGLSSRSKKAKKRKFGDPVVKHPANTRDKVGLELIPQEAKTATFNAIPSNIKVDFFNNVIRTAFPNFDNLMIASWNVVSIYSNVGTDFPELHKSIVELKSVLQDFEESFGAPVVRRDPKVRRDFAPNDDSNVNGRGDDEESKQPTPDVPQEELKEASSPPSGPSASSPKPQEQEQDDNDSLFNDPEPDDSTQMPPPQLTPNRSIQMPPPRLTPRQLASDATPPQRISNNSTARSSPKLTIPTLERSSSRISSPNTSPSNPRKRPRISSPSSQERTIHPPKLYRRHEPQVSSPRIPSSPPSVPQPLSSPHNTPGIANTPTIEDDAASDSDPDSIPPTAPPPHPSRHLSEMSTPALKALYATRRSELVHLYGALENVPAEYRLQMRDVVGELKGRRARVKEQNTGEEGDGSEIGDVGGSGQAGSGGGGRAIGGAMPTYLGNSVLGERKTTTAMGLAPVAPMMGHLRRESGGGGAAWKGGE